MCSHCGGNCAGQCAGAVSVAVAELHATARMYSRHELVSGLLIALYSDAIRCAFCDARLVDFIAP
jgi:hypothetical protein